MIMIISLWNHVKDFKTAYIQSCFFLIVMNWFDGSDWKNLNAGL